MEIMQKFMGKMKRRERRGLVWRRNMDESTAGERTVLSTGRTVG